MFILQVVSAEALGLLKGKDSAEALGLLLVWVDFGLSVAVEC